MGKVTESGMNVYKAQQKLSSCTFKDLYLSNSRKYSFHFDLSNMVITLKVGQGHQNWYEHVKLSGGYLNIIIQSSRISW